jgi:UDP-glucuronate decarboxylase
MTVVRMQSSPMLVAGGAGFLGSHLCERLLQKNIPVLCLDSLVTGNVANVAALAEDSRFRIAEFDVSDPLEIESTRGIFNLACPASPVHYQADPIRTTMTSVRGTYNLLELARISGARLTQASTSEVYGDPSVHPQTEGYWGNVNPTGIRSCYDEGKRCAESLCFDYHRVHGVDVRVARIFNTYGPRMQIGDGRVVSNFIVQALLNEPITIYGDGEQTRSFCYVDDLIDGLLGLMNAPERLEGPMNIGNPEEFTVMELAELILELTGSRSRLIFLPLPSDDPTQRCPDIGLARRRLGWEPRVPLREGLQRTIAYFDMALSDRTPRRSRRVRRRSTAKEPLAVVEASTAVLAVSEPGGRAQSEMEVGHVRR